MYNFENIAKNGAFVPSFTMINVFKVSVLQSHEKAFDLMA
jgi:hypothetical protein